MRNFVSLVASLLLLPAFGAPVEGSASSGEADPRPTAAEAAPGSTGGELSPDRPVPAKPTVDITFARIDGGSPDDKFTVKFEWSDSVTGFALDDITVTGASKSGPLLDEDGGEDIGSGDSIFTVVITTNPDLEGKIVVKVRAGAVNTSNTTDTDDENDETSEERRVDNKKPALTDSTANEFTIVLTYHERVDRNPNGSPAPEAFTIDITKANGQARVTNVNPASALAADNRITLRLKSATDTIQPGDTVELTYAPDQAGSDKSVRDSTGNEAAALTNMLVENERKITTPGKVGKLTATATHSSIKLDWVMPEDTGDAPITAYRVWSRKNKTGRYQVLPWPDAVDDTVTEYLHEDLSEGDVWDYEVEAKNIGGWGDTANVTATVKTTKPGKVDDLVATADGETAIDLEWSAPDSGTSAITGYKVQSAPRRNGTWTALTKNDTVSSHKHRNLTADTTVYYRVRATNEHGDGPWSDVKSATTEDAGRAPTPPRNLRAAADGQTAIDLRWVAPSDSGSSRIMKYRIEVSDDGTDWGRLTDKDSTATTHKHTGLSAGDTRHYRVFAINATDTSAASDTARATTSTTPPRAPDPPTGLEARADGQNAIDLEWDAPSDTGTSAITGYRIEASKDDTTNWRVIRSDTDSRATTYEHDGLDPGDTYHYRVSAISDDGTSDPSNVDDATTDAARPGKPKDLDATAVDSTQIDLAWNPPDDDGGSAITGYRIEWSPNGNSGWDDLDRNTESDVTSYSDTTLSPNTTRHYRVSAINEAGEGPTSDVAHATTTGTVPGRPTLLRADPQDTARIGLQWRAPDDDGGSPIEGYRIEVSDDGTPGSWVDLERNTGNVDTEYTHTGLRPGSTRFYRVSAINSAGTGSPSRLATAKTLDVPDPPTGLTATAQGQTQINLAWNAPADDGGADITGYRIEVSENGGATWRVHEPNTLSESTAYPHTGLSPGETRHYRVRAINEWGPGESSNVDHATTDAAEPGPPRNLVADANGQTRIDLDWDPPADDGGAEVTGYRIEFSRNGATWSTLEANTNRRTTLYHDTGLKPGTTRHYRVAAINSVGPGEYSDTASATTAPAVPGAPTGLSAVADGTSEIDLSWNAPADDGGADITGYRIEVSDNGSTWRNLRDTNTDDTEFSHTGLDPGTTRHYRVSAINAAGVGEASAEASATTDPTVPDAPTGLAAAADGQTRIDLSWTAPAYDGGAPVTGYRIGVSADGADTWTVLASNTGSARTTFTHTGLQPGTTRHYRVFALNVAGASEDHSNVAHATTDATVPDPPTGLAATANGISRIDLAWTTPVGDGGASITGYRVEVSTTRGATWTTLVDDTETTSTAYSHTGLPPATRRDYRVSAINRVGAGKPSNVAEATTDPDLPDPPTDLAAQARGSARIELSWNAPTYKGGVEITGYRVEVSDDVGGSWTVLVANTDSDDTDYAHTGLDPASTRHYRVYAINVAGVSEDHSNIAHATTDPVVPDAPTGLAAAANGTSRIDLVWTAPDYDGGADITGYRIEVSVDAGIVWRDLVEKTPSTATVYAHTGLDPASTRHYRVSAINRAGVGAASNEAGATTDATVPDAPTRLNATADSTSRIDLAWTTPGFDGGAAITGYRIEVSQDAGSNWTDLVADTRSTETVYPHTGLDPASTRHYRVSAINEIGTGDPSNVANATTDATVPDPPTGLVAVASSPTQIDLTWTAPAYDGGAPVTSYRVEVSEDGGTWADLARSTGSAATSYSHVGLRPGSTRHYRVSAINVAGTGAPSAIATASTDDPVERAGRVNEAILPHFAAAATTSSLGAIAARIEAVAARNPLPSQLRAAGLASLVGDLRDGRGLNTARLLNGASFVKPLGDGAQVRQTAEGFGAAAWGSAEFVSMGEPGGEEVEWDGGMLSIHLGADMRVHRDFLAGMSASRSAGDYDFTDVTGARKVEGTYEARMNSVNPYIAWLPGRTGVAVWAVGSFGWGDVAVEDGFAGRRESDARSTTGAVGASRILVANGASALRVRAEGWLSRVDVDEADGMDSLTLDMERARFALEWSQVHKFRSGDEVTVLLEGGARFGDGEGTDGAGMEFGGGLRYANPASGLTMEGHGRMLATGGDSGYEEWGVRGLIQIDPQAARGLSMKLVPTWGEPASGVQELWERGVSDRLGAAADMRKAQLNAELEYGLSDFQGTPYGRVHVVDGGTRAFGTGMRYEVTGVLGLRIEGTRTQSADAPARHGLALKGHWKFGG